MAEKETAYIRFIKTDDKKYQAQVLNTETNTWFNVGEGDHALIFPSLHQAAWSTKRLYPELDIVFVDDDVKEAITSVALKTLQEAIDLLQYHVDAGNFDDDQALITERAADALETLKETLTQ